ncbi:MAG: hypothetical protein Q4C23_03355 [Mycoplasmatota bacterium]|nr:hypothetical protein [Mycoplasmatota bacterium]
MSNDIGGVWRTVGGRRIFIKDVSLLINLGCDSRDVANRIGDTVNIVEKTYYHMFPTKKNACC